MVANELSQFYVWLLDKTGLEKNLTLTKVNSTFGLLDKTSVELNQSLQKQILQLLYWINLVCIMLLTINIKCTDFSLDKTHIKTCYCYKNYCYIKSMWLFTECHYLHGIFTAYDVHIVWYSHPVLFSPCEIPIIWCSHSVISKCAIPTMCYCHHVIPTLPVCDIHTIWYYFHVIKSKKCLVDMGCNTTILLIGS